MLSVVVPVYNVAPYLDECLASIAAQYYDRLEVIVVDDGSTDGSPAIAAAFAERDPRFVVVTQPNAGLGAARNTGTRHATGEYLMFVDSDDVLPPYAAELLISSIETTGSDFAAGNVLRLDSRGLRQSALHRKAFATTVLGTHVSRRLSLMDDRTAWNKVFRRTFYDRHELAFPEGVLYEDIPVTMPAHVLATAVDVLDVPVYYWREREGADKSITQRRDEVGAFLDRLTGVRQVSDFLAGQKQAKIKRNYDAAALNGDLMIFMKVLPRVGDDYRRTFLDKCREYLDTVDPRALESLPAQNRVLWRLVRERQIDDLLAMLPTLRTSNGIVRKGLRRYHDLMFLDAGRPDLPRSLFLAGVPRPRTRMHSLTWRGGRLHLRGHAFVPSQPAAHAFSTTRMLWLTGPDGRETRRTPLANRRCTDATAEHGLPSISYDWSGFEADIDPDWMRAADGTWPDGVWSVQVGVVGLGQKSKGPFEAGEPATAVRLSGYYVDKNVRVLPVVTDGRLELHVEHVGATFIGAHRDGDAVEFSAELSRHGPLPAAARLSRAPGVPDRDYPVTSSADAEFLSFRVPLTDLHVGPRPPLLPGEPGDRWNLELTDDDGDPIRLAGPAHVALPPIHVDGRTLGVYPDGQGHPVLTALPLTPVLTAIEAAGEAFRFAGQLPPSPPSGMHLVLRTSDGRESHEFPVTVDGHAWTVEVDPLAVPSWGHHVRLRTGTYHLLCRFDGSPQPLPLFGNAATHLPLDLAADPGRVTVEVLNGDRGVLRVRSALRDDERGRFAEAQNRDLLYPRLRRQPLRDAVLYSSPDSAYAVHRELVARDLTLEHLWVVDDGQAVLPPTAREVVLGARPWYDALATSRYIVTDRHLPEWFRRRDGQVVVQTGPGTPIRRIPEQPASGNWTHLISPNGFSTPILRQAFGWTGEVLEIGCPRTDRLSSPDDSVRARLDLPPGKKIVLYAPARRDDEPDRFTMRLDLAAARARLGDDHVLLVRRHPDLTGDVPGTGDGFGYDVSAYPEVADLLAVADVLVTDYSGLMADFALTGRPMLFFAYDLEHYRGGFTFDFEAEAPGPLLRTSDEVIGAIREVDALAGRYADRYRAFAERVGDHADGRAAERLADAMLKAGTSATRI